MKHRKIHVLQMIGEFTSGGAETVVVNLARSVDDSNFSLFLAAREDGPVSTDLPDPSRLTIIPKKHKFDLLHLTKLIGLIKGKGIDLIHSHLFGPNFFGFFAAKLTRRKIIQTIHGSDELATKKRVKAYGLMSPWVDQIVTVSEILEAEFKREVKCKTAKLTTIYNGIPCQSFKGTIDREEKVRLLGLSKGRRIIGTVGNVKPVKGHDVLINALRILVDRKNIDILLVIVGIVEEDEPHLRDYKSYLDRLVTAHSLRDKVVFLGVRQDVHEILHTLDVYVLPSRSEGLSMSLLEAMAAERPIVATNVGMNSQIIQDGTNGLIVPPENPHLLARALLRILDDPAFARALGRRAFQTVHDHYTDTVMAKKYENLYTKILGLS